MSSQDIQKERPSISFHKYFDAIFVVVKKEIFRVFLWLYQGGSQYVGDYLKTTPRGMKRLRAMEKKTLERRDLSVSFDITVLYTILQHTCGLAEDTADIWNKPTTPEEQSSLEHTLYLLKEKRNEVSHKLTPLMHMTQRDLGTHFKELRRLCCLIIREAGQKGNRSTAEVNDCVVNMEKALEDINTKSAPSGFTAIKFAIVAKHEMIKNHNPSPSSSTFVMPLIQSIGNTMCYEMFLKNFPLWRCDDGSQPMATILQGDIGTGKTSICGYILDSWVSNNDDIYDLQDFDLVVPLQCCKVSTRDLQEFLRNFIGETMSLCNREEIPKFLESLRILWLIDGFEEATVDATELLKKIKKQGISSSSSSSSSSHLMFITTKPQRRQELIDDILVSKDKLCIASLSGLREEGVILLIKNIIHEKEKDLIICETKRRKFMADVRSYGKDMLMDLRVPLKLKLMIELWQDGKLHKGSGASLHLLYEAILNSHTERLQKKLGNETKLKVKEISSRISSWLKVLCEAAFDMTLQKLFVKINPHFQMNIEKAAESLVYPEDCLAIFLQCETTQASGCSSYSFVHSSQQFYLSSRHVSSLMECESKPDEVLERLLKENILSENRLDRFHFYQVLLHIVSSIAMQQTLEESVARVLTELLSVCSEFDAFEVVQYAAYSPVLVKEVSKYTDKEWKINDPQIKAVMALMQYVTPSQISVHIESDPNDLKEFHEFLKIVSRRNLIIAINLYRHYLVTTCKDSSHQILAPIFSSDAKCHLVAFYGQLSIDGSHFLLKMSEVRFLTLRVSSNKVLSNILSNLQHLNRLQSLKLILSMPVVTTPLSSHNYKIEIFDIALPLMDETRIKETSLALTKISKQYNKISLYDISPDSAVVFIKKLEKKRVKVNSITRVLSGEPYGSALSVSINNGPVPLNRTIHRFHDNWRNTYLKLATDDTGRLMIVINYDGISSGDLTYNQNMSLSESLQVNLVWGI